LPCGTFTNISLHFGFSMIPPTIATAPAFAAALSTSADAQAAAEEACRAAGNGMTGQADLAMVFVSPHHRAEVPRIAEIVRRETRARILLGCTGETIVGGAKEIENQPAVSLWLARLPGVTLTEMHLTYERTPEGGSIVGWPDELLTTWPQGAAMLVLGEPFSFPTDLLLNHLNEDHPGVPVLGGMASASHEPGGNRLIFGDQVVASGAVAVLIHGAVAVRSVVSQGCRPIGRPMVVTKAERNIIYALGGRPALEQLHELFVSLSPDEQRAVQSGLHVGIVTNEYQEHFDRGDFLVRNVIGADKDSEAIAVGDYVRVGQTVQFHVRDARTADEDLRELLTRCRTDCQSVRAGDAQAGGRIDNPSYETAPRGALLFTCNGRGTRMFDQPHHDAGLLRQILGDIPVAGFFAAGEVGPVAGKNFVHGFTASVALFSQSEAR
jgi:small ligand-binding sensory domain FIST